MTASTRPRTGLLVLMALVALLLSACSTTGADEPTRGAGQQGYPGVDKNLTRVAPDQRTAVPGVSGPGLDGASTVSTADYSDKVVVVNVWGSWCSPCRAEAADLEAASIATKDKAQFIGITTKDYDEGPARAFVRAHGITYPSIFDPQGSTLLKYAGQLPPLAIPSTLIIDRQGRLAARVLGPITKITLVDMIDDIAAGK